MLDALLPIVVLIALLALTIALFGIDATNGPLQVALLLSAAFASLIAFKNGYTVAGVADAAVGGVTSAVGAIFILLAVGALIGTWNMAGTIPTIVDYRHRLVSPTWFYLTAAVVCALVGMVTGSSWTTAGTLGVAFVGMANVMGLDHGHHRGCGDLRRLLRRQDDPALRDHDPGAQARRRRADGGRAHPQHVLDRGPGARHQPRASSCVLGLNADPDAAISTDAARAALATAFNISWVNLLPLLLLVVFSARQVPAVPVHPGIGAVRRDPGAVHPVGRGQGVRGRPEPGSRRHLDQGHLRAMATGFVSNSGVEPIDALFTRGGMASLLTTIWLVLGALSFAAVMEHAGFLQRPAQPIVARARRRGPLILAVNSSGIGLNVIAGDQYVADVLPARMFRGEFARRGLAPQVLSRAVEDSGTVTSVLVPWNTCGAYISGVLGVSTAAYFPFCFFNLLSPVLDVLYGFIGFKVPTGDSTLGRRRTRPWPRRRTTRNNPEEETP